MENKNLTVAIVITCTDRDLKMYATSVTQVPGKGLVLRKGVEVGSLHEISDCLEINLPVIVFGDYQAQASSGFVTRVGSEYFAAVDIVGGIGSAPLRRFDKPIESTILSKVVSIKRLSTHKNSNHETAKATLVGLEMRSELQKDRLIIVDGQSDRVMAFELVLQSDAPQPAFPIEHRLDIFNVKEGE